MFHILISDLQEAMECTLGRFADDTKWGETADTLEGKAAFQR